MNKKRIGCTFLVLITTILVVGVFQYFTKPISPKKKHYDVIIILGNGPNPNNKPNVFLKSRLDRLLDLAPKNYSSNIILTGSNPNCQYIEADIMAAYLKENYINSAHLILEPKAKNTVENIQYCQKLIDSLSYSSALIITSKYHIPRTTQICKKELLIPFELIDARPALIPSLVYVPLRMLEQIKIWQWQYKDE